MAFKLGNRLIDRVQFGYVEAKSSGELLYLLNQLKDTAINITAEAKEYKDAEGNIVKKAYKNKAGTLEAKHAWVNTNIVNAASGDTVTYGASGAPITAPKIIVVPAGTKTIDIPDAVEGTVKVSEYDDQGGRGTNFKKGTSASATEFAVSSNKLTLPTVTDTQFIVKYDRTKTDGAVIINRADKFPKSTKVYLKALYYETCDKDVLKGCYIVIPSFMLSPETSLPLNEEAEMDYKGDIEVDYCGGNKVMYYFYDVADEEDGE